MFPTFTSKALIGRDDIYLDVVPGSHTPVAAHLPNSITGTSVPVCWKLSDFQTELQSESSYLDSLLEKLREYYTTIKKKWRLNFDVPAGFQKTTQHQQNILHSKQLTAEHQFSHDSSLDTIDTASSSSLPLKPSSQQVSTSDTNLSSNSVYSPIIRSVDKPSSSLPHIITLSDDYLRASVGFRWTDSIHKDFSALYQDTVK